MQKDNIHVLMFLGVMFLTYILVALALSNFSLS